MLPVSHHIPEDILAAYAAGSLPHAFSVVVAAHISLCDECRATLEAVDALGGALLESRELAENIAPISPDFRSRTLAALDAPRPEVAPQPRRSGIYPGAIMAELRGRPPRWRNLGAGIRQSILSEKSGTSARLLFIPGGRAVPDHGHGGLEMTLVLQGAFSDHTGYFGPGDVQVVATEIEHTPIAEPGPACVCLAATDMPLRFNALIPRMLQRVFRI